MNLYKSLRRRLSWKQKAKNVSKTKKESTKAIDRHAVTSSSSPSPPATTTLTDSEGEDAVAPAGSSHNQQQHPNYKYIRGGGYCRHGTMSYEERWSSATLDRVVTSWASTPDEQEQLRVQLMDLQYRVRDVHHSLNHPNPLVYFVEDATTKKKKDIVAAAEKYFRHVVAIRQNSPHDMDTLLLNYELPDDYDYFPWCVLQGTDRDDDPMTLIRTGVADCWGLYQRHGREIMIRHALTYQELDARGIWQDDYEDLYGKLPGPMTVIVDLKDLSTRHIRPGLVPILAHAARIVQDCYPESIKRVLVIRAPAIFKFIWGLVQHFFDPELRDVMVFGTTEDDSHHVLERYIDPNVLPHCIHPAGIDGPVARGYEHVILEGGRIPPEGTYQTPQHIKDKALEHARAAACRTNANTANKIASSTTAVPTTQGKMLLTGSFDLVPCSTQNQNCKNNNTMLLAQEYKALVHIDTNSSISASVLWQQ
jgi:hypothetical protein